MVHHKKKIDLWSLDFTQKCSQNAGNAISETLNSNIFWRRIATPLHMSSLCGGPIFFPHTYVVLPLKDTFFRRKDTFFRRKDARAKD